MQKQNAIKWISIVCAVLIFVLTIVLIFEFVKINQLKRSEQSLLNSVQQLEKNIIDYTNTNNYLNSEEFVEDYARENLGWGKDGEIRFES